VKKIAFFNNKGGVGKTTLVYHVAHMLVEQGRRVLLVDLDPQANLSAMCLSEERLEQLWAGAEHPDTVFGCTQPILNGTGDLAVAHVEELTAGLGLIAGDLNLSSFESRLSDAWLRAVDCDEWAFRALSAFHRLGQSAGHSHAADLVLFDVGPNLGAINRSALLASDFMLTPLAPDPFSVHGLRNLAPAVREWRKGWSDRLGCKVQEHIDLPAGRMAPLGYVVMQADMQLTRPVSTYDAWLRRLPLEFHEQLLDDPEFPTSIDRDPWCLGVMRPHQSLLPLAQDAKKPMFQLRPGDGAIGGHMMAVQRSRAEFDQLATRIVTQIEAMG
jgi:chromosome partitioning protein